jgi:hypothetical protein
MPLRILNTKLARLQTSLRYLNPITLIESIVLS